MLAVEVELLDGSCTVTFNRPVDDVGTASAWSINSSPGDDITEFNPGEDTFAFSLHAPILSSGTVEWTGVGMVATPPGTLAPGSMPYP